MKFEEINRGRHNTDFPITDGPNSAIDIFKDKTKKKEKQ
jgi:hypothetical protein